MRTTVSEKIDICARLLFAYSEGSSFDDCWTIAVDCADTGQYFPHHAQFLGECERYACSVREDGFHCFRIQGRFAYNTIMKSQDGWAMYSLDQRF